MPCPVCGASVPVSASGEHVCDESRRLDFRVAELRDGIERFPTDFGSWLDTPAGRFAQWLAVRDR